jgi:hypothetical protein
VGCVMRFTLTLECDNAAFDDSPVTEVARILDQTAEALCSGYLEGTCLDVNGNDVGDWRFVKGGAA